MATHWKNHWKCNWRYFGKLRYIPLTSTQKSKTEVDKLIPKLKYPIKYRPRYIVKTDATDGSLRRLVELRQIVTALFKYERIETKLNPGLEARDYAERLISEAAQYGDRHRKTMDRADFWLEEKQLIHKLFKVLVPRYQYYTSACTKTHLAPVSISDAGIAKMLILELKGNPYPPVVVDKVPRHNQLQNILLFEAKQDFYEQKKKERLAAEQALSPSADLNDEERLSEEALAQRLDALDVEGEAMLKE